MNKMTIGEYLGFLSDKLTLNPDLSNEPLYSENGILFGWEDSEDAARRMDVPHGQMLVWINEDRIEGVRSNDHVIIPPGTSKPENYSFADWKRQMEEIENGRNDNCV